MKQFKTIIKKTVQPFLIIIFILSTILFAYSTQPKWYSKLRKIKVLKTTREDIEKLFGHPQITYVFQGHFTNLVEYKLKEGQLSIAYSLGKCSEINKPGYGYDVAKDVVIDVDLDLEKTVDISKLQIDSSDFDKAEISDIVGVFTYRNESIGEYYTIGEYHKDNKKELRNIQFFPSENQENLACKK